MDMGHIIKWKFFYLLTLIISLPLLAETKITYEDLEALKLYVGKTRTSYYTVIADAITEQPISKDKALKVYIPVGNSTNDAYSLIPSIDLPTALAGFFKTELIISNNSGEKKYLKAAVFKDGTTYIAFDLSSDYGFKSSGNAVRQMVELDYTGNNSLCDVVNVCNLPSATTIVDRYIYLFLTSDSTIAATDEITVNETSNAGGVFLHLYFNSNAETTAFPTLSEIKKGDGRLTLTFDMDTFANGYKTLVFRKSGDTTVDTGAIQATSGASFTENDSSIIFSDYYHLYPFAKGGDIVVSKLTNNKSYNLSVGLVDKYQFVTPLSNSKVMTPEKISEFIESSACYLISAGFKKDHYVLDYFRYIRDSWLKTNFLGREFVQYYYQTAPHYAQLIFNNQRLSVIIISLAFNLYYFFHFLPAILLLMLIFFVQDREFFGKKRLNPLLEKVNNRNLK